MEISPQQNWESCLTFIKNTIGEQPFNTWFMPIGFYSFDGDVLRLNVPSKFFVEYIEGHYLNVIRVALRKYFGNIRLGYHIELGEEHLEEESTDKQVEAVDDDNTFESHLDLNHSFDNFIQGKSNRLPVAVAKAIAEKYQNAFNPFFIYGASGVGKTHLANAIGTKVKELQPKKKVLYVSAHLFQIQFTESVKHNTFNDFMHFYQSIDVLIIDDIHEIAGKAKTQEAFFNIFNHLHRNQKQLILTCDRPPVMLEGMMDRLLSRFKWGMIAELESPDYQLRKDILNYRIEKDGLSIPEDVVDYIAQHVEGSIRNLEGVMNSLIAHAIMLNIDVDIHLADNIISKIVSMERKVVSMDDILEIVSKQYTVKIQHICSSSRKQNIVQARQIAVFLSRKLTNMSSTQIGQRIGRDHSTVIHSCSLVEKRMGSDTQFRREIEDIEKKINS